MNKHIFIQPGELKEMMTQNKTVTIVDVRSPGEYAAGHIEGAVNIPAELLQAHAGQLAPGETIVTVCNFGGQRSCDAADLLQSSGFGDVRPLHGGIKSWQKEDE